MKMDKHLIYRHIVMLQSFAGAYNRYIHVKEHTNIYEVIKLAKNESGVVVKYTSFMLSDDRLPVIDILSPVFVSADLRLLDSKDINRYIHECADYGISIFKDETQKPQTR